jgi:hypothetical protein
MCGANCCRKFFFFGVKITCMYKFKNPQLLFTFKELQTIPRLYLGTNTP